MSIVFALYHYFATYEKWVLPNSRKNPPLSSIVKGYVYSFSAIINGAF